MQNAISTVKFMLDAEHLLNSESQSGLNCSKLTTSLVNVSIKFQTLIFEISQYFLLKKCEKIFFQQKISVCLVIKS